MFAAPFDFLTVYIQWAVAICGVSFVTIVAAGFLMSTIRDQFPQAFRKKQG